jgi:hypothetical protein
VLNLFQWFSRNFALLISGLILLPLALYALLMFIGFGYGFTDSESIYPLLFIWLISFYVIVFGVSIKLSIRSYKKHGDYKYWDFMPMVYFFTVFIGMFWGKF